MTLAPGSRLGSYEVLERVDAGGMGIIFRARDLRLGRHVALKILPDRCEIDAGRLARFEREGRILASLSHPNINTLHDLTSTEQGHALVLELVEGDTLTDLLADGPIAPRKALSIAVQIAAAFEAAHEHGIVHRDLKPSNVMVQPDGSVKVLDFGLAKMIDSSAEGSGPLTATATATALDILPGGVCGTPAYMSPEQARGLPVDHRTDIWAFGCVLYEMLTGAAAFRGATMTDTLAAVIHHEPDWSILPDNCPAAVRAVLRRCLEKDPMERTRHIGDARLELREALLGEPAALGRRGGIPLSGRIAAGAALLLVGAIAAWLAVLATAGDGSRAVDPTRAPVTRFAIADEALRTWSGRALAVSPDGKRFAYESDRGVVIRSLDRLDTTLLSRLGAFASSPFFSPDGAWIGYGHDAKLQKAPISGGAPQIIAEIGASPMGTWTSDGIVFADSRGLFRIPAEGGTTEPLVTDLGPLEQITHPQVLPGRDAVLYTVIPTKTNTPGGMASTAGAVVAAIDLRSGDRRTILRGGGQAQYVSTGHLVYAAGNALHAIRFDLDRLEAKGDSAVVLAGGGRFQFAVANEGTLLYTGGLAAESRTLVWVDRHGREEPLGAPPNAYVYPRISPDGTRVALDVAELPERDIHLWDLRRKVLERFTLDPAGNALPAWNPDGRYLVFASDRFGMPNLFWQLADGSGEPQRLVASQRTHQPLSFAPDGRLIFSAEVPGASRDIYALSMDGSHRIEPIIESPGSDLTAEISPDGRWIAYDSDESGRFEVYVRPYPGAQRGSRRQISSDGGRQPLWSPDGRALYYRAFSGDVMGAQVSFTPTFDAEQPSVIVANRGYSGGGSSASGRTYDIAPDGTRFLMIKMAKPEHDDPSPAIIVVLNWFQELRLLLPLE
jgi:serine/threonine-protein kinase